jgi:hypothetical protein
MHVKWCNTNPLFKAVNYIYADNIIIIIIIIIIIPFLKWGVIYGSLKIW